MSKTIAILGAGGHGKVVGEIALLNEFNEIDFYDDKTPVSDNNFPFKILGTSRELRKNLGNYDAFFIAIGDNKKRSEKTIWLDDFKSKSINLIHPKSTLTKFITLGSGICVMAGAVINSGTVIGDGSIINTSASIDHDCHIKDFVHISPNCSLSGNIKVGNFTHIGTGSSIHPGIQIGYEVKVAVGSKIYKNIPDNTIYKK